MKFFALLLVAVVSVDAQFGGSPVGGLPNPASAAPGGARNAFGRVTTPLAQITSGINSQKANFGSLIGGKDASAPLTSLFPGMGAVTPDTLVRCYNSTMGKKSFNVFDNSFTDVITEYYKEFPENFQLDRLPEKVKNLFQTLTEIATRTVACVSSPALQQFQVGLTTLSDFSPAEFKKLMGATLDPEMGNKFKNRPKADGADPDAGAPSSGGRRNNNRGNTLGGGGSLGFRRSRRSGESTAPIDPICFPKNSAPLPASLDYRSSKKVTPIKFQGTCGGCWAFSSVAALESAYLIQGKTSNEKFDLSEQQLIACANPNFCNGGTSVDAYNFMLLNRGVTDETIQPFKTDNKKCETKKVKRHAKIKDYCLRGVFAEVDGKAEVLTDEMIQKAIREFGVVYSTIYSEMPDMKNFKSGLYSDAECNKETNHAINIVGWDEEAWIVRNSWSEKWGENGYFRLKRGGASPGLCGIRTYITYPILE